MSATNKTTNYELPIFVSTDKPAWLVDWNGAMNDIDTSIKAAHTAADNAQTTANTATSDISTLSGSVSTLTTSVSTLSTQTSTNTGSINTITSLIGNGEPTTQDKTLIGAINELAGEITAETAADVSYDNTESGLSATDVQGAIDEIATASPATPSAANVSYNNTTSGLAADDVQEAIDEVVSMIPSSGAGVDVITGTLGSEGTWVDVALPTGYTIDNTIVVCVKYRENNGDYSFFPNFGGSTYDSQTTRLSTNGFGIYTMHTNDVGKTFYAYLMKVELPTPTP